MVENNVLIHYGIKRRSGRYPWGSGDRPYQRDGNIGAPKLKYTTPTRFKIGEYVLTHLGLKAKTPIYGLIDKRFKDRYVKDNNNYLKMEGEPESLRQLKKQSFLKRTSTRENCKIVNPNTIKVGRERLGRTNNCVNCVAAMEMRARGYDVIARSDAKGHDPKYFGNMFFISQKNPLKVWHVQTGLQKNGSKKEYMTKRFDDLCNKLEQQGPGARGTTFFFYDKLGKGGHAVYYQVGLDGKVNFYDGQSGKINNTKPFALADPNSYSFIRFDDLKINSMNIGYFVKSKNKKGKGGGLMLHGER